MPRRTDNAFTLIELLCVIALIGIIAVTAAPAMVNAGKNRGVELAARGLAMDIRKIQQKAIATGWQQEIVFRPSAGDYLLRDGKTSQRETVKLPEGVSYHTNNFPRAAGGFRSLAFTGSGAPSQGGTLSLINRGGKVYYLIVTPATGRVRVSEDPP